VSEQITFTGCVLKSFSRTHTGGTAKFSSNFTASIGKAMGWPGFPDGTSKMTLVGDLAASTAQLQPTAGELSKWMIEIQASAVNGFEAVRYELEGTKGKGHRFELHFTLGFKDMTACRFLEEFMTHVGEHKSSLKVFYTQAAEQSSMIDDGTPTLDEERRQATLVDD
jgi:hypothetical protein